MEKMPPETAVTVIDRQETALAPVRGSAWTLARLSDQEFTEVMELAQKGRARMQMVMRSMMRPGTHFGHIPGTPTDRPPTLLKPGMELLCQMFSLVPDCTSTIVYGDGESAPHITVQSRCSVHAGSLDGPVVATGEAACSSWEKKYRYRASERICPECGKAAIIKGSAQYGGGWLCWKKKDGCGAKWPGGAAAIEDQKAGQTANPDPFELLNTITKIANKRARMEAIISATHSSDLFTQDIGDNDDAEFPPQTRPTEPPTPKNDDIFQVPFGKNKGRSVVDLTPTEIRWYIDEAKDNLEAPPDFYKKREYDEKAWLDCLTAQLAVLEGGK